MIGMPVGSGTVPWATALSLINTIRVLDREKIPFKISSPVGCSVVTWARSAVAGEFLASNCSHLFWIDSDIVWFPDDFVRLLGFGAVYPIIGATYPLKKDQLQVFCNTVGEEGERIVNGHGNVKVHSLGLGFTLVQRKVIEALAATKETVTDSMNGTSYPDMFRIGRRANGNALGEDVAFFEDCEALGFEAWLDPSINLGHVGTKIYRGDVIHALGLEDFIKQG
jgi:hypothetical protein